MGAVPRVDDAVKQSGGVARALLRGRFLAIEHAALPALLGQRPGGRTASQAGADDHGAAFGGESGAARRRPARHERRRVAGQGEIVGAVGRGADSIAHEARTHESVSLGR